MDYSKADEALKMFGGDFQKMMEGLSDWAEKMVKSDEEDENAINNVYTLGGNQEVLFLTENSSTSR